MIRSFKRKFILITMFLLGIVIISMMTFLFCLTKTKQEKTLKSIALRAIDQPVKLSKNQLLLNSQLFIGIETVELNSSGDILNTLVSNEGLTDSTISKAINTIKNTFPPSGSIDSLNLIFQGRKTSNGYLYCFIDTYLLKKSIFHIAFSFFLTTLLLLIFFIIISFYLASIAVKPLEEAWRSQEQFIADVSHELKTPITINLTNTAILLKSNHIKTNDRKWIQNIEYENKRMQKLIEKLLFLSSSKTDILKNSFALLSMNNIINYCILQFEPIIYEAGLTYKIEYPEEELFVFGCETQLKQLIMILLDNACKYSTINSEIKLSLIRDHKNLIIYVNNTGSIIPSKEKNLVFNRFYRIDKSRNHSSESFGLGLSIAKEIISSHKGTISLQSNVSTGTTFKISLPLYKRIHKR